MINILIVEDNLYKLDTITKLLKEDLMIESKYIDVATEIKSAKKLLNKQFYDLLILDLVLPLESGDAPTPEKGVRFLNDINSNPSLNPPIHIIGITSFVDLKSKFDEEFHNNLWHLIDYEASQINWQDKLKNVVNHLVATRQRFFEQSQKPLQYDVAIITALHFPEFDKILELSSEWERIELPGDATQYYSTLFKHQGKTLNVLAACSDQMGMPATSNLATKIILRFNPRYLFMGGICAGLKEKELNYGDVIIAEQSWDYGSGKMKEESSTDSVKNVIFEPDPRPIQLSPELKGKVNSFLRRSDILAKIYTNSKYAKPNFILKAKLGPVASGSYVIASLNILSDIKIHQRKLLGIEMEAYGMYYSAEHSPYQQTKAIMIKSVSDFGDSAKNDTYQDYASFTSAQFIYHFIIEELMNT